ncbi:MAG: transposase [Okeania sp. SIO2H7]|nr:transposase [Okeania sp. SIO2H7]
MTVKAVSAAPPQEANAGQKTIAVNPQNTSQDCSNCGKKVPKELNIRTHSCPYCGIVIDRDLNAAINIKSRAVGHSVLKARGARRHTGATKREAHTIASASVWEMSPNGIIYKLRRFCLSMIKSLKNNICLFI